MIRITHPFHGAVLHAGNGRASDGDLVVAVSGTAPFGHAVTVNGHPAERCGTEFRAEVRLRPGRNALSAVCTGTRGTSRHDIAVIRDTHSVKRYRVGIDDNSFFLRDIAVNRYASLFDCPYLDGLRKLHRAYGTRFSINCFFATPGGDFSLPDFPPDYRGEWADNADWLNLTWHAWAEFPDRPYEYASPQTLARDLDATMTELRRIAGDEACIPPTIVHWGMCRPEALPVLRSRGSTVLSGYFRRNGPRYDINYCLDDERSEYLSRHDALADFDADIVFSTIDIVVNSVPLERIVPTLEPLTRDPDRSEIMDVLTHEQYFWPFYAHYVPDHFARMETAIRFLTENGYAPVMFHEGFLGGRLPEE